MRISALITNLRERRNDGWKDTMSKKESAVSVNEVKKEHEKKLAESE